MITYIQANDYFIYSKKGLRQQEKSIKEICKGFLNTYKINIFSNVKYVLACVPIERRI